MSLFVKTSKVNFQQEVHIKATVCSFVLSTFLNKVPGLENRQRRPLINKYLSHCTPSRVSEGVDRIKPSHLRDCVS